MLDGVDRNARRLRTMIEDMLTISKIELGAFTSRLQPLDLGRLLPPAADVIRPSAGAGGARCPAGCPRRPGMDGGGPRRRPPRPGRPPAPPPGKPPPRAGTPPAPATRADPRA